MSTIYVDAVVDGKPLGAEVEVELTDSICDDEIFQALLDAEVLEPSSDEEIEEGADPWKSDPDWRMLAAEGPIAEQLWDGKADKIKLHDARELVEMVNDVGFGVSYEDAEKIAVYFYCNWNSTSLQDFRDAFQGVYATEAEFAEQETHDFYSVPSEIEAYIDYEKFAHDLFMSDFSFDDETGAVFRNY